MENGEKKVPKLGRRKNIKLNPSYLHEYLERKNFSLTRFAKMCNISFPAVRRFYDGDQPSYLLAKRIALKTNQEIRMKEMGYE